MVGQIEYFLNYVMIIVIHALNLDGQYMIKDA